MSRRSPRRKPAPWKLNRIAAVAFAALALFTVASNLVVRSDPVDGAWLFLACGWAMLGVAYAIVSRHQFNQGMRDAVECDSAGAQDEERP